MTKCHKTFCDNLRQMFCRPLFAVPLGFSRILEFLQHLAKKQHKYYLLGGSRDRLVA